jgi:hypothetical protein
MKPTRGWRAGRATWNLTLDVLTYKGIKVNMTILAGAPLANITIDFNPGVCLYGHNGRIITLTEFLDALSILVTHLTPLLSDPDDWVDLVPGLRRKGRAYWSYLEVPSQYRDPEGVMLARLRHLLHPSITTPSRLWPTSIEAGGHRGKLQLSIYRKDVEMVKHGKLDEARLADARDILRLEARMRADKLVLYFGNERNVEMIDGKERLVWFYPEDLVRGHRKCFSELQGVYTSGEDTQVAALSGSLVAQGRQLAQVADDPRTAPTFPELLALVRYYTGASSATIKAIRDAGVAELSRRSGVSRDALFSDAAYEAQFGIASEEPELMIRHEFADIVDHRLITAAYRPPEQPFFPHTVLPTYHR